MLLIRRSGFEGSGWRRCRPLFFVLLLASTVCAEHPLVRDVTVTSPDTLVQPFAVYSESNVDVASPPPVGAGLLRFYGCITCHDLAVPPFRGRWGPDLDTIGSKTTRQWLERHLADPSSVTPGSRMPRVPMTEGERASLVAWLASLTRDLPIPADPGTHDGRALYGRGDCKTCHSLGGVGGDRGPVLDGVADKIRKPWLVAYLLDPGEMVRNTRMPLFGWEPDEASALADYLLQGQSLSGGLGTSAEDVSTGAVGIAVRKGCFQCHKVARFARSLDVPTSDEAAATFVGYHAADPHISISLTDAESAAMIKALRAAPPKIVDDGAFLEAFWEKPIPAQGAAPEAYQTEARGTHPEQCGTCHVLQHEEWASSLHAKAMGPGVTGQLLDYAYTNGGYVAGCQACHAPNAEQHASLDHGDGYEVNYRLDSGLRDQGITCLACHVRSQTRFGPPVADRPPASVWLGPAHGGAHEGSAFTRSEFCSPCHQFGPEDARLNGKLIQDTFEEWRRSPQAAAGETCQSCHMPGRAHTWLGIHDSTMVADAMRMTVLPGDDRVSIRVENIGAGHHLPTYVTPRLIVNAVALDGARRAIENSRQHRAIGREIVLTAEERRELYDTRIPAGGTWMWSPDIPSEAVWMEVRVICYPDQFYAEFFAGYDTDGLSETAARAIEAARDKTAFSSFQVLREVVSLR